MTYHLNRLQALHEPDDYCVTLNATDRIAPGAELARMVYEHPAYTRRLAGGPARPARRSAASAHTAYCGAYHGWGFHEDGCVSGVRAAAALGVRLVTAALYEGHVAHRRSTGRRIAFRHPIYVWLVDVDELPRLPRRCGRSPGCGADDHLSGPQTTPARPARRPAGPGRPVARRRPGRCC